MPARLFCQTGSFAGSSFDITDEVTIGRDGNGARVPAEVVSGTHARIFHDAERGGYFLEDLDSRNGTRLDGVPVLEPVKLGRLHVVTLADQIDFIFLEGTNGGPRLASAPAVEHTRPDGFTPATPPAPNEAAAEPAAAPQTTRMDAFQPGALPGQQASGEQASEAPRTTRMDAYNPGALPGQSPASGEAPAQEQAGETPKTKRMDAFQPGALPKEGAPPPDAMPADSGQQTRIGGGFAPNLPGAVSQKPEAEPSVRFSIEVTRGGRSVTFPLEEGENVVGRASDCAVSIDDKSVSRKHAVLVVRGGRVAVRDLGSRNHTYLDERQVDAETEVPLGGVLRFGVESTARLRRA